MALCSAVKAGRSAFTRPPMLGEGAEERRAVEALKISLAIYSQTEWLNSPKLTVVDLREKVVLVQFWTYTCIKWLRTLSYVCAWAKRYKDQGLVVIGVHTPEFAFQKDADNVHVLTVSR